MRSTNFAPLDLSDYEISLNRVFSRRTHLKIFQTCRLSPILGASCRNC